MKLCRGSHEATGLRKEAVSRKHILSVHRSHMYHISQDKNKRKVKEREK